MIADGHMRNPSAAGWKLYAYRMKLGVSRTRLAAVLALGANGPRHIRRVEEGRELLAGPGDSQRWLWAIRHAAVGWRRKRSTATELRSLGPKLTPTPKLDDAEAWLAYIRSRGQ